MAIKLTPSSSSLSALDYYHTKEQFPVVESFALGSDACCFGLCEMPLPVFADLDNETISRNNDFTKFIFKVPSGSAVTCVLSNLNTGVDYNITDTTYGAFADLGDIATEPLVWSFVLNWYKVANLITFGDYKINVTITNGAGSEIFNENSPCYYLRPFSCENAQGTIRFEVLQNGYIQDGFDYRNMTGLAGFFKPQQIRVYGSIDRSPITTTDYLSNSERENLQVQTAIHHEYTADIYHFGGKTYDLFFKKLLLQNPITVNSYDGFDSDVLKNRKLSYLNADKAPKVNSKQERVTITLEDNSKATVKRY
jgi:hypothetical protein